MGRLAPARRFLSAYYVLNVAGLGAYLLLRRSVAWGAPGGARPRGHLQAPGELWFWEQRAAWVLSALAVSRFLLRATADAWAAELLGWAKLCAVVLLGAVDARLGGGLALLYLLLFLLAAQPRYEGPQAVEPLTPATLAALAADSGSGAAWLVMATTGWSAACRQAAPTFAGLSLRYGCERLRFGEVDVGRWPRVAKQHDICIESVPFQLPCFLLFRGGRLVRRLPEPGASWDRKGRLAGRLVREFDLDMLLSAALKHG